MSEGPQLSSAIRYFPRGFERDSTFAAHVENATALSSPSVLLVGRNASWGTSVLKPLEKHGTEFSFVAPRVLTSEFVRSGAYNLILLDSSVTPDQRRQLVVELLGSEASIFYTFPVENGCWWLPTLRRGQYCHGAPAFRRSEFPFELQRILSELTEA